MEFLHANKQHLVQDLLPITSYNLGLGGHSWNVIFWASAMPLGLLLCHYFYGVGFEPFCWIGWVFKICLYGGRVGFLVTVAIGIWGLQNEPRSLCLCETVKWSSKIDFLIFIFGGRGDIRVPLIKFTWYCLWCCHVLLRLEPKAIHSMHACYLMSYFFCSGEKVFYTEHRMGGCIVGFSIYYYYFWIVIRQKAEI